MNRYNIYTIYNKLTKRGEGVNLAVNDATADKIFQNTMKKWSEQGLDPKDFMLVRLGEIDLEFEMKEKDGSQRAVAKNDYIIEKEDGKRSIETEYINPIYSTKAEFISFVEAGVIPPDHDGKNTGDEAGVNL